ncbi:MAG TPA: hypothetical protein VLB72_06345 [Burkholderiales bacterium]|nr:hypothetical protein [Burkholderiales bacterium]HSF47666.1 hypothetical protein [Burkholderiales bacterium]
MGGLAILLIIAAYIGVASVLVYKIKPRKWKVVTVVAVLLVPTIDAVLGRLYLRHLCVTEAGLKVYRVVENVEGFLDGESPYWITKHGFKFAEGGMRPNGNVNRVSLQKGQIFREWNVPSKSLYRIHLAFVGKDEMYERSKRLVEVIQTSEILASYTQVDFRGGWAERFLGTFSDAGASAVASCDLPQPEVRLEQLVIHTLKPIK